MALRWELREHRHRGRHGPGTAVDNLALVPASLLTHKTTYQRLANQLPTGTVLVVLPTEDTTEQQTLHASAAHLRAKGHPVVTLSVDDILATVAGRPARPRLFAPPPAPPPAPSAAVPTPAPDPSPPAPEAPGGALLPAATAATATIPPFTHELRLVSIDLARNRARFYLLRWQPTLWGEVALVRMWGRIGSRGRAQVLLRTDAPQLDATVTRFVRRRLRHGYVITDWQ
jgi:predicted DNA-binding WGR domain protein